MERQSRETLSGDGDTHRVIEREWVRSINWLSVQEMLQRKHLTRFSNASRIVLRPLGIEEKEMNRGHLAVIIDSRVDDER